MSFFQYQNGTLLAEQAPLAELAQRFGTPLYVYSRAALEKNYHAFDEAFAAVPHQVCYAPYYVVSWRAKNILMISCCIRQNGISIKALS